MPVEVLSPDEVTTLVRGTTVVLSTRHGEIRPGAILGIFGRDERLISLLSVTVDGVVPPTLGSQRTGASTERVASLAAFDEYRNGQALLTRRRTVRANVVVEEIELRSFGAPRTVELDIALESDAAEILHLKGGVLPGPPLRWQVSDHGRSASITRNGASFVVIEVDAHGTIALDGTRLHLTWKADLEVVSVWSATWSVHAGTNHSTTTARSTFTFPTLHVEGSDYRWSPAIASARADLEALVIDLPEHNLRFVGAGAPWYQAIFGRDSLIAGWQSLPLGTDLALDILDTLAAFQGTDFNKRTVESPGKILHERRIGRPQVFGMAEGVTYFGSVDASSLFVMLLAEVYRWGAPVQRVRALLPAARRALSWCQGDATVVGGIDRSPFVWYTPDPNGLGNQCWKDSGDSMMHADGTLATGSLAVAEAQAYLFEALQGMARLERDLGDPLIAHRLESDAKKLAGAFADTFWCESMGLLAMAIDETGNQLRVASSNMGQCLWSGVLAPELAARVADRAMKRDLFSPWGIRTLGDTERAYNPLGYHLGTVWAHDSAIVAAGLARFGHAEHFRALASGLLSAAESFDWRLPELFAGLDTSADGRPLPYPASCSPQAWSAGAPLLLLRSMLGLQPDIPAGKVIITPLLAHSDQLAVHGLQLGGRSVSFVAAGSTVHDIVGLEDLVLDTSRYDPELGDRRLS